MSWPREMPSVLRGHGSRNYLDLLSSVVTPSHERCHVAAARDRFEPDAPEECNPVCLPCSTILDWRSTSDPTK